MKDLLLALIINPLGFTYNDVGIYTVSFAMSNKLISVQAESYKFLRSFPAFKKIKFKPRIKNGFPVHSFRLYHERKKYTVELTLTP